MKNKSTLLKIIKKPKMFYIFVTTGENNPCKNLIFKKSEYILYSTLYIRCIPEKNGEGFYPVVSLDNDTFYVLHYRSVNY